MSTHNVLSLLGCILLLVVFNAAQPQLHSITVHTYNGTLEGEAMRSRNGKVFISFRGIPYAQPPLGKLRFQPPKPAIAWDGVRFATTDAEICTQRNIYIHQEEIVGGEDCLYLNVYTPKVPTWDFSYHQFPVMIWLHGGGWVAGAGHFGYYGPKFLLDHDVVLVTVNYRLGPLGFLSTEDLECPGNMGMKDQAQAIRWVQENIFLFGGDPNRVTIFGESAGGASVHYHMISPLSQGLFHRGISQSGTSHCPWTLTPPGVAKKHAKILGEKLDCPTENSKNLITCLKKKSAVDIIGIDRDFQVFDYCPMIPFRLVIEPDHPGAFLTEDPVIATKSGRMADIPWMTGVTSEEGALKVPSIYGLDNGKWLQKLNEDFKNIAPLSLLYENTCRSGTRDEITRKIREFYLSDKNIDESDRFKVVDMYSDAWFVYGANTAVRDFLNMQTSPVFYYYFAYKGSMSFTSLFGDTKDYGVSHADDLQYIFPVSESLFTDKRLSLKDYQMIDVITTLWFNFAKSGNPTPSITKIIPVKWKPVKTPHAFEYLFIGNDMFHMDQDLLSERMNFWDTLPVRTQFKTEEQRKAEAQQKDEL